LGVQGEAWKKDKARIHPYRRDKPVCHLKIIRTGVIEEKKNKGEIYGILVGGPSTQIDGGNG